jgi:predicted component of type VI protein secretion system
MPFLIVRSGARAGERIEVTEELVVGRENADVTLEDEEVSRRHLAVRPHDDGVELEDLGSTNGTFVDGARLSASVVISETARVMLGETELEIEVEVPEPEVDPGATRLHERPAVPDATVVRPTPVAPPATAAHSAPAEPAPPERAPAPPAQPEPAPAPVARAEPPLAAPTTASAPAAVAAQPFGAFTPSAPARRRGGPATRLWAPATLVFLIIIATAVALVIYFAAR